MKVDFVHFTTVHSRDDIRIVRKELGSLAAVYPGRVGLFVQDGLQDGEALGGAVKVWDVGVRPRSRIVRAARGSFRMWRALHRARPKIAHFHDPELLFISMLLAVSGVKVVYDVHEDVPKQILTKPWIPRPLRAPLAKCFEIVEKLANTWCSAFVAATSSIGKRFPAGKTVLVQNFPLVGELEASCETPYAERPPMATYVGGISAIRGAREMIEALTHVPKRFGLRLSLAGRFAPSSIRDELVASSGWRCVDELGWLDRSSVAALLGRSRMGLVLFHPVPNHTEAQPNKLFEYMSAGLPVVASDFPLWREIVSQASCGLLVDPMDPRAIAEAMCWILNNPEKAREMGIRGREAVLRRYSWSSEATKLIGLYRSLEEESSVRAHSI